MTGDSIASYSTLITKRNNADIVNPTYITDWSDEEAYDKIVNYGNNVSFATESTSDFVNYGNDVTIDGARQIYLNGERQVVKYYAYSMDRI